MYLFFLWLIQKCQYKYLYKCRIIVSLYYLKHKSFGGAGYRSPYLSHAKRALYHLSYAPIGIWRIWIYHLVLSFQTISRLFFSYETAIGIWRLWIYHLVLSFQTISRLFSLMRQHHQRKLFFAVVLFQFTLLFSVLLRDVWNSLIVNFYLTIYYTYLFLQELLRICFVYVYSTLILCYALL